MTPVPFETAEPLLHDATARALRQAGISTSAEQLTAYVRRSFADSHRTFIRAEEGSCASLAACHRLAWDSDIYGVEIGAIGVFASSGDLESSEGRACLRRLARDVVSWAKGEGLAMLVVRAELEDLAWIQALEELGFRTMDVQSPLVLQSPASQPARADISREPVEIREFIHSDLPHLLEFAGSAFGRSHLYADPELPTHLTDRLYEAWTKNDCSGRAAFVDVALHAARPCGFLAGLWDNTQEQLLGVAHGHIDLVAVRTDVRKLGIGRQLLAAATRRFVARGAQTITVSTQATNLPAIRLYQASGYQLAGFSVTLHGWIDGCDSVERR